MMTHNYQIDFGWHGQEMERVFRNAQLVREAQVGRVPVLKQVQRYLRNLIGACSCQTCSCEVC